MNSCILYVEIKARPTNVQFATCHLLIYSRKFQFFPKALIYNDPIGIDVNIGAFQINDIKR